MTSKYPDLPSSTPVRVSSDDSVPARATSPSTSTSTKQCRIQHTDKNHRRHTSLAEACLLGRSQATGRRLSRQARSQIGTFRANFRFGKKGGKDFLALGLSLFLRRPVSEWFQPSKRRPDSTLRFTKIVSQSISFSIDDFLILLLPLDARDHVALSQCFRTSNPAVVTPIAS